MPRRPNINWWKMFLSRGDDTWAGAQLLRGVEGSPKARELRLISGPVEKVKKEMADSGYAFSHTDGKYEIWKEPQ